MPIKGGEQQQQPQPHYSVETAFARLAIQRPPPGTPAISLAHDKVGRTLPPPPTLNPRVLSWSDAQLSRVMRF